MRIILAVCVVLSVSGDCLAAQVTTPTWRAEPIWRLDADAVESGWSSIDWVSVRGDGLIAVSQPEDGAIRFVTRDGEYLSRVGRRGGGPGEFRSMPMAGWSGDTLLVFDRANARATALHPETGRDESHPFRPVLPQSGTDRTLPPTRLVGPGPGGGALVLVAATEQDPLPEWPAPAGHSRLAVTDASGALLRQVGVVPPDPCFVTAEVSGNRASVRVPLCQPALLSVDPGGIELVVVTVAPPGVTTVTTTNLVNGASRSFTIRMESVRVSRSTRDSLRHSMAAAMPDPALRAFIERELVMPEHYPVWSKVIRDRDGRTWLEYWQSGGTTRWLVLSPSGTILGSLPMPEGVVLKAVDRDRAVAVHTDALGEETLVGLRIRQ
jgi:hypothetical protein